MSIYTGLACTRINQPVLITASQSDLQKYATEAYAGPLLVAMASHRSILQCLFGEAVPNALSSWTYQIYIYIYTPVW